jgi:hypothetical protein
MLSQKEFISKIVEKLQEAGIDYVICGSAAATFYGVERTTEDTDIVINPTAEQLKNFLRLLGNAYYVSSNAAFDALKGRDMFNVIDIENIWKADLIIKKETDFSTEEFCRKRKEKLFGRDLYILSPEDSILSKLLWAKQSRSEMQYCDIMKMLETQSGNLDVGYLKKWSKILDVEDDLNGCISQIKSSQE